MRQWGYRYYDTPDGYVPCSEEYARAKAENDLAVVVIYRDSDDSEWTEEEPPEAITTALEGKP